MAINGVPCPIPDYHGSGQILKRQATSQILSELSRSKGLPHFVRTDLAYFGTNF